MYLVITLNINHHYIRIFIANFDSTSKINWIYIGGYDDLSHLDLYVTGVYFAITTIVTVGYGDITAKSTVEKIMCCFLMIIGVVAFSFLTGSLASIISN